jgi:RimJ/RimL family protein N-acetyltransferase
MTRASWAIRPKGERDVDGVVELLAEVAREGRFIATEWPFDVEARAQAMRDAILERRVVGWIAVDGRHVVGNITIHDIASAEPEIGMIVRASHRGRGIGAALLAAAQTWARANGKPALRLRVFPDNENALALYRAHGFAEVELQRRVVPRRDGSAWDALLMRWEIAER